MKISGFRSDNLRFQVIKYQDLEAVAGKGTVKKVFLEI